MATNWNDLYAQCPFYQRCCTKGPWTITCQGVTDASNLQWRFRTKRDCTIQLKTFCMDKFQNCEIFQAIYAARADEN